MLDAPQPPHPSARALWITIAVLSAAAVLVLTAGARTADRDNRPLGATGQARRSAAAARSPCAERRASSSFSPAAQQRRRAVFAQVSGDEAFVPLGEPQPGDWLWSFREPGQTFDDYSRIAFNRRTERRRTLHLQPYDDLRPHQRALLAPVREYVSLFFDTPTAVLPARKLRRRWLDSRRQQYDAEAIADDLAERVPLHSLGLLGVAGSDLFALRLSFVFGVGLFQRRAGVYSLHRYGTRRLPLLRRTLQLATHELGHMFSLKHCVFYACLMNGTNSLAESDRQPLHLCPVCLAKLHHNLGFDPPTRHRRLARYYREHGLVTEAAFAAARARQLAATAATAAAAQAR